MSQGLGAHAMLVGPHHDKRYYETTSKLNQPNARETQGRKTASSLWLSLVRGEFSEGKAMFDRGELPALYVNSPPAAITLVAHLAIGGYSASAKKALKLIEAKSTARFASAINAERAVLSAIATAADNSNAKLKPLEQLLGEKRHASSRSLVTVALFHIAMRRGDVEAAKTAACNLWNDANAALAAPSVAKRFFPT